MNIITGIFDSAKIRHLLLLNAVIISCNISINLKIVSYFCDKYIRCFLDRADTGKIKVIKATPWNLHASTVLFFDGEMGSQVQMTYLSISKLGDRIAYYYTYHIKGEPFDLNAWLFSVDEASRNNQRLN